MAIKNVRVDDIDGTDADVTSVTFALNGKQYSIDLSAANQQALTQALDPFIAFAKYEERPRRQKKSGDNSRAATIREWARQHNIDVPQRGRIPADVEAQYNTKENHSG